MFKTSTRGLDSAGNVFGSKESKQAYSLKKKKKKKKQPQITENVAFIR